MILKRLGAVVVAAGLIVGAFFVRDRLIDDGGSDAADPPRAARRIVCVSELRDACEALGDEHRDLEVRVEEAATTLDALAALEDPSDAPLWVTLVPFPAMVDDLRVGARREPLASEQIPVVSSPVALVVIAGRAAALNAACGDPLDWVCVGANAGNPWSAIGGEEAWRDVRPAFAPIDSAIGLIGVADAVAGYFGGGPIQLDDPDFVSWARRLARAVPASAVSGRTAITTIQTRASALDIAVGAAAELADAGGSTLTLQYAEPMIRADVVLAVPAGTSAPRGVSDDLAVLLTARGWEPAGADPNPLPSARELLAIREAWKETA